MQEVIGLGQATSQEGQNKKNYLILDDFHKFFEDSMLIYHGEMVTIILHEFIVMIETSEHVQTLGGLFQHGGTTLRSCYQKSKMALFGPT